ncbi:MAG: ribonuclease HI [Promethearchaeota archaeon]
MSKKGLSFLKIYVDGAARGNPGPAASAFIFVYKNKILHEGCDFIGKATNNTAEYKAIINALKDVHKLVGKYEKVEFIHVKRDDQFISICDRLCNERLDAKGIKFLKK